MVVDTDDYVGVPNLSEKDPVAIINPDNIDEDTEHLQDLPMADDRTSPRTPSCRAFIDIGIQMRP